MSGVHLHSQVGTPKVGWVSATVNRLKRGPKQCTKESIHLLFRYVFPEDALPNPTRCIRIVNTWLDKLMIVSAASRSMMSRQWSKVEIIGIWHLLIRVLGITTDQVRCESSFTESFEWGPEASCNSTLQTGFALVNWLRHNDLGSQCFRT